MSKGMIPKHIQESWGRCYSKGLVPTTIDKPDEGKWREGEIALSANNQST